MCYKSVLVPVDFSELNEKALEKAAELQSKDTSETTLVHAVDYIPPPYVQVEIPDVYGSETAIVKGAVARLNELIAQYKLQNCKAIVRIGRPKTIIGDMQKTRAFDLIIMAKHSQKGISRLLGSVTNSVLQSATCDVLVLPE